MSVDDILEATAGAFDGGVAVIRDMAHQAAARTVLPLVEGRLLGLVLEPGQHVATFDLNNFLPTPARKVGSVRLADAESFVKYTGRHSHTEATTLWGDVAAGRVIAVLDDHHVGSGDPGWGEHRAVLALASTPDWDLWLKNDGKLLPQAAFAEHIEEGAVCVRAVNGGPSAADMLEVAQTFQAKTGVDFKAGHRLASGEVQFRFEETTTAKAGQHGSLEVPSQFTVALQPFYGSPSYEVTARFRYRLGQQGLTLGYKLVRPDLAREQAFADVCADITEGVGLPVFAGAPR